MTDGQDSINQGVAQTGNDTARRVSFRERVQEADINIRDLMLMLWRRKNMIILIMALFLALTSVVLRFVPPEYEARTLILFNSGDRSRTLQDIEALSSYMPLDTSLILSEIEVIRSRTLARAVIQRLNLMNDPEFNAALAVSMLNHDDSAAHPDENKQESDDGSTDAAHQISAATERFKSLNVYSAELEKLPDEVFDQEVGAVVTNFLKHLSVRSVPGSMVMQIQFTSRDPAKAALISNTVADAYIETRMDEKFKRVQKVASWLDTRLQDLRKQVRDSESAVQEYKEAHDLTQGVRSAVSTEELSQLHSTLVQAKSDRAAIQAKLEQVDELKSEKNNIETAPEVLNSGFIVSLKKQEADLKMSLAQMSEKYGDKHPDILKTKSELAEVEARLDDEMKKIHDSLSNELQVADARVVSLKQNIEEIENRQNSEDEAMIHLRELERDAASNRLIFDMFMETYKKSDKQDDLYEPQARIISYAIIPNHPSYPNKMLILSLSSVLALFFGLALALFLEKMDNTYRSAGQLETQLGYPCFALVPTAHLEEGSPPANYITDKPSSTVAEAVRTLRTVLNLRGGKDGKKPQVVTITSSFPGEGKTTMSSWLSRLAARSGEKVLLIDADLRRPNVHRSFGHANDVTLVEILTGKKEAKDVIRKDELTGLDIVYARSVPNSALDLISSSAMKDFIEAMREIYDLIIIDSPACLAVSDARVLARYSDHTIYAVEWNETPREVVISGVKQFYDMGYENMSFVLSNVDVKRHVQYGYGDTAYYYGRYREYYAE